MFEPENIKAFRFLTPEFDFETGVAKLHYAFDDHTFFTEEFTFPLPVDASSKLCDGDIPDQSHFHSPAGGHGRTDSASLTSETQQAINNALLLLSMAAGVSYYKAAVPTRAIVEFGPLTQQELAYFQSLYFHGLGEFAYVNQLDLGKGPQFQAEIIEKRQANPLPLSRKSLVAVGGGKDSCVSIESMRSDGSPVVLASVNRARPILDVIAASGLESIHIKRTISPELLRINKQGAYNGHVPITAIVSIALSIAALIHDCDAVVMSNERSASIGNVEHNGVLVNHQYSKGLEAETMLSDVLRSSVTPSLDYFSLLRPLSELEISRRFAKLERYHDVFTSCNRAFRIDEATRVERWCGDCPKCRFVFLALAPFMHPQRLTEIFGKNMLDDETQIAGFNELIGWNAFKPFECVGEVEESLAALVMVSGSASAQWSNYAVVKHFIENIRPNIALPAGLVEIPFIASETHHIPMRFERLLDATA